jgi:5-(carboxyamino)imidazole ribonucleotide synthase
MTPLPPGSRIGILGGGQLGRMTALAAARLGYRCHILAPEAQSPAGEVAAAWTQADYLDDTALHAFARAVDVVTLEFENVPVAALDRLAALVPVRPSPAVLATCQDRLAEKAFLAAQGIPTATWAPVHGLGDLESAISRTGLPAVLKTARLGYDGKGQAVVHDLEDARQAWLQLGSAPAILEGFVRFAMEMSVVIARGLDGGSAAYVPVENRHEHHILRTTIAPAALPGPAAAEAVEIARRIAEGLDLVGVLGVEMFWTQEQRILVNELAPRPHNSGHWTIDACWTSQFEQQVRAVCGLPLGEPGRFCDAVMTNLLGDEVNAWPRLLAEPGARLHLYGKREARPGRKMGHVTRLGAPLVRR